MAIHVRKKRFAAQVHDWVTKTKGTWHGVTREALILIFSRIDERTPIGDPKLWKHPAPPGYKPGLLRGSWVLGVDTLDQSRPGTRDAEGKMISVARAMLKIPNEAAGHIYYYTSSLPYTHRIEYGWSKHQAPFGVVGVTVVEFKRLVAKAVKKVREENA